MVGQIWQITFDRHIRRLETECVNWLARDVSGGVSYIEKVESVSLIRNNYVFVI